MNRKQLYGQSTTHLIEVFPGHFLHEQVVSPYRGLVSIAGQAGIDLRLASGYRSFDRQLAIWNAKVEGARPVCDDRGDIVAIDKLSGIERVCAILRWSALPGASRHHWGTDVDVWDASAVSGGYQLQLLASEYQRGGVFQRLTLWLDEIIASGTTGFYRPYVEDCGGVAPELWHLSYRPLAEDFEGLVHQAALRRCLENSNVGLKQVILDNFDELYQRFVSMGQGQ